MGIVRGHGAGPACCARSALHSYHFNAERTEYRPCVAWDRPAEITGQFLSKGQVVDIEGRLQTRQWDEDAGSAPCDAKASHPR